MALARRLNTLAVMPGIDYARLRAEIRIEEVLALLTFQATDSAGEEIRGPCPIHGSSSTNSRSFSANLRKNTFRCFKCGVGGNQLELYMAVTKLPLHEAARRLVRASGDRRARNQTVVIVQ